MNIAIPWNALSKLIFRITRRCRQFLPRERCEAFGESSVASHPRIARILVINLDRQPGRWVEMTRELKHLLDSSGLDLLMLTERFSAVDANRFLSNPQREADVDPVYTLKDQLFVEPLPTVQPERFELDSPIRMSRPEIAVAHSHINVWRQVAAGNHEYVLVLEDDVWFQSGFARKLDLAWDEIVGKGNGECLFDILYLSYQEVRNGAPKSFVSRNVFRPSRGLWELSGYVISRQGAEKLAQLLPCRGPVDLWLNHQFRALEVRALRRPIIRQRRDGSSTNLYSILPALTRIGAITSEGASLFQHRPTKQPVFVFGLTGSGLSSLATALSMLGYRCCSDLQRLPDQEWELLRAGRDDRIFNAYVNIGGLATEIKTLRKQYPQAKFIVTRNTSPVRQGDAVALLADLDGAQVAILHADAPNKWQVVCDHLECAPPPCLYPEVADVGQRQLRSPATRTEVGARCHVPRRDSSPWIVEPRTGWEGIHSVPSRLASQSGAASKKASIHDCLNSLDERRWTARSDTFIGNLALFRPSNLEFYSGFGAKLAVKREPLGVREYSAAALSSRDRFLFGRFEAMIKATNVPGIVTGFFLHRDSPRQEIDIEIAGHRPDRLLVNVFFNPGGEGATFDYGYRGAATYIDLGFDASEDYHHFAIEWEPWEIRWFVDNRLVHTRVEWDPTPIPNLPMAMHINAWPSMSKELAGRLARGRLPTASFVRSIDLLANFCPPAPLP